MILNYAMVYVTSTLVILGALTGIVGCWLFLQQKSLYGDTIAHATFPGLTLCFFLTGLKNTNMLLMGGLCSALCATLIIYSLHKNSSLKKDTILGITLAGSFGIGSIMLTKIQSIPNAHQAGIAQYLLGNPATMLYQDCIMIIAIAIALLFFIVRYFNEYKIILFDPVYAQTVGIAYTKLTGYALCMITITTVLGLQAIGIILMSALLINPAAAAYQWTKSFKKMLILSSIFGAISCCSGTLISCYQPHIPTGPVIIVIATCITICSILFGPHGIFMLKIKRYSQKTSINTATLLSRFLLFNEGQINPYHAHDIAALNAIGKTITPTQLNNLQQQGYVKNTHHNFWCLTHKGVLLLQKIGLYKDLQS